MSNYRITNGELVAIDTELYHHGVKGMKWGVIRSKAKEDKLLSRMDKLDRDLGEQYNGNARYDRKSKKYVASTGKHSAAGRKRYSEREKHLAMRQSEKILKKLKKVRIKDLIIDPVVNDETERVRQQHKRPTVGEILKAQQNRIGKVPSLKDETRRNKRNNF